MKPRIIAALLPILLTGCSLLNPKFDASYNPETKEWHVVRQGEEGPFMFKGKASLPDGTVVEVEIKTTITLDAAAQAYALQAGNVAKALELAAAAAKAAGGAP